MDLKDKVIVGAVAAAVPLIAMWEGYSPRPYVDVVGVLTDCYGNTKQVSRDRIRTKEECEALLNNEVGRIATNLHKEGLYTDPRTLAAITSFTYNVGDHAYRNSTLRKRFQAGLQSEGCAQLNRWVYGGPAGNKRVIRGLVNRRSAEYKLCMEGVSNAPNSN